VSTFYWVNGSGSWDATSTANWSNASGGSSGFGPPTSADNVIFDANSNTGTNPFTVTVAGTVSAPSVCNDFSTGGAGGALDGAMTLTIGASGYLDVYGSMTLPATNLSFSTTAGALIQFQATTTGKTITTNGVSFGTSCNIRFSGVGGGWTLGSALTANQIFPNAGTLDTGNYNLTINSIQKSVSTVSTLTLGSSTVSCSGTGPFSYTGSNLTFNAGTSTISCSGASPTFAGGGQTFYNVSFTSGANGQTTITGANTFNNLSQTSRSATGRRLMTIGANQTVSGTLTLGAANTAIRRIIVTSDVVGTQRTITLNGTLATLADVDFQDIATAGTVGTWTGTRLGDGLNNSGITFDAPKTVYWNLAGSQSWSSTGWATTNTGTPAVNNFPLAQDTAVFTEAGAAGTINIDSAWFIGAITMADGVSNRTTAMTLTFNTSAQINIFKNITLFSNLTISGTAGVPYFYGQGTTQTITSAGVTFTNNIVINSPSGTVQLLDNLTTNGTVQLVSGTLDLSSGNRTLTCNIFSSSNSNTRSILFGTGNITITGNAATIWTTATATGFSYTGTPTVNATYSGSVGTRTIAAHSTTGATESNALSFNISAGTDIVATTSTGNFKNLNFTGFTGTLNANTRNIYGNLILSSGMTLTGASNTTTTFAATSGTQQITTNGITLDFPTTQNNPGATLQLQDNLTMGSTRTFTLTAGTLDLTKGGTANLTLSTGFLAFSGSSTRSILFGTGQIDITGNNGSVISAGVVTNFTYTGTPKVNLTYSGSTGTRSVFFGNSGGYTESNVLDINVIAGTDIVAMVSGFKNVNFTGFSGSLTSGSALIIYGNLVLSSTMTVSAVASEIVFNSLNSTQQITTNGLTIDRPIRLGGTGTTPTIQLQDALTMVSTRTLTLISGTFDANNYNVTTGLFSSSNSNTRTLTMGSGTWTIQGSGNAWDLTDSTNLTLNEDTSTISMTSASAKTFTGSGNTYYNLNQGGTGTLTIVGDNTFNNITDSAEPSTIQFTAGSTQTVNNFTVSGSPGNLITLESTVPGSIWYLTKTSGTVTVTYCDITDSDANGGATFNCINGVNGGNNTGWNFSSSSFSSGNFLAFF
jgi:hypothetical protein